MATDIPCPDCGRTITADALECPACGAAIPVAFTEASPEYIDWCARMIRRNVRAAEDAAEERELGIVWGPPVDLASISLDGAEVVK